jgi:hypothetical protein
MPRLNSFLGFFLLIWSTQIGAQTISDFQSYTAKCPIPPYIQNWIVLRKFTLNDKLHYLIVNPDNLITSIQPADGLPVFEETWENISKEYKNTVYFRALADAQTHPDARQDAGITHLFTHQKGVELTVDLCPSHHPMDRVLFVELVKKFNKKQKPVPIGVAISGLWMEKHPEDLAWLLDLEKKGEIAVTWINHSYHHYVWKNLSLGNNFLLGKKVDMNFEVLQNEVEMIEKGLTPSVFFRFPGLVSDKKLMEKIMAFGLIPIGSDAWLGKNQRLQNGSIVLVHANGNEPIGIKRFLKLIRQKNIMNKQWLLFDLREGIMEQEQRSIFLQNLLS